MTTREDQSKKTINAILRQHGEPKLWPGEWEDLLDLVRDPFEPLTDDDMAGLVIEWRRKSRKNYGAGPPPRRDSSDAACREHTSSPPAHWRLLWQAEMQNFQRLQQEALDAVSRDAPDRRDFIPEDELGSFLQGLADRSKKGPLQVISYRVKSSDRHPNGAADIGFHEGYWNTEPWKFRADHRDHEHPLATVKRIAQSMARELLIDESQCVSFLLSNRVPDPPWIRAIVRYQPGSFVNGKKKLLLTLEIQDPLLTTPEEVRRLYSTVRQSLFGRRACYQPWRQRMVDFVNAYRGEPVQPGEWSKRELVKARQELSPPEEWDDEHLGEALALLGRTRRSWPVLVKAWNELHPEHQYNNSEAPWRSMYESYHRDAHSASDAG